jgi:hypothetical protein
MTGICVVGVYQEFLGEPEVVCEVFGVTAGPWQLGRRERDAKEMIGALRRTRNSDDHDWRTVLGLILSPSVFP